jgi:hypothetical protein
LGRDVFGLEANDIAAGRGKANLGQASNTPLQNLEIRLLRRRIVETDQRQSAADQNFGLTRVRILQKVYAYKPSTVNMSRQFFTALLLCATYHGVSAATGNCIGKSKNLTAVDCGAWQDLYNSTNGPKWDDCSDIRSDPCACGSRVTCAGGYITTINLDTNNLAGTIPSSIGSLAKLTGLRANINSLTGTIPSSIGSLTNLTLLQISMNKLTGLVPPLPFAQYIYCSLDYTSDCTEPNCNHFTCPLPVGSDLCYVHCT